MVVIFTNVIKPTHVCNLDCTYCYNEDVRKPVMSEAVLARAIEETIRYGSEVPGIRDIDFIWHGGEPMAVGLDFYRRVVDLSSRRSPVRIAHTIQTNGTLLDQKWADFLKANAFRVSVSIDGPAQLHDQVRVDRKGRGSHAKVMVGIEVLRENHIPFGVCVVISRKNKDHVDEIYDFLVENKLPFNVIPLTRSGAALSNYDDVGIDALEYAAAWTKMFDRWFATADDDYVFSSDFVHKTRAILSGKPTDCIGQAICSAYH